MKRFITSMLVTVAALMLGIAIFCHFNSGANKYLTGLIGVNIKDNVLPTQAGDSSETTSVDKSFFSTVDKSYFDDALFIGDSRTVGIQKYSGLDNADYFAKVGLTVYDVGNISLDTDYGTLTLTDILRDHSYKKVYVMFGVNEIAADMDKSAATFKELINTVRSYQSDAIIYIEANLHVGKGRSDSDPMYSNKRLDEYNKKLSKFANNKDIFYIDVNEIFDDVEGNLASEYTGDNVHLQGDYNKMWADWLCSNAVVQ